MIWVGIPPLSAIYIDSGIGISPHKSLLNERVVDFDVPLARGLLEAVDSLLKQTDVILFAFNDPPFGLFHVDFLVQVSIEERSLYVHCIDVPVL